MTIEVDWIHEQEREREREKDEDQKMQKMREKSSAGAIIFFSKIGKTFQSTSVPIKFTLVWIC